MRNFPERSLKLLFWMLIGVGGFAFARTQPAEVSSNSPAIGRFDRQSHSIASRSGVSPQQMAAASAPAWNERERNWVAQGNGHGRGAARHSEEGPGDEAGNHHGYKHHGNGPQFSSHERQIISSYFGGDYSNLPPGLAKRGGNLPPGLERQLQRNGSLPPGLQKRLQPFPPELSRRLPPLPVGYSRRILGRRALILNSAQRVMDIMNIP